jgi:alpha-glucosidase
MAAVYYSPIQTLFWYDKPSMSKGEPELEFWDSIPTTWDETKVLQGKPGEYVTTARRSGDKWFIGTLNNITAKTIKVSFDFLPKNKKYRATIYSDDEAIKTATKVKVEQKIVKGGDVMEVNLKASGGQAMMLQPL